MNMSGYEVERVETQVEEYGDEVMCSGWNHQLTLVTERTTRFMDRHVSLPASLADVDVETFLNDMYANQC
jgi:hypothetical protein